MCGRIRASDPFIAWEVTVADAALQYRRHNLPQLMQHLFLLYLCHPRLETPTTEARATFKHVNTSVVRILARTLTSITAAAATRPVFESTELRMDRVERAIQLERPCAAPPASLSTKLGNTLL